MPVVLESQSVEVTKAPGTNGVAALSDHTVQSMASDANPSQVLSDLVSEDQRRLLDTVDGLRDCALGCDLSLPQLVVCGDQSSGKSSVLEALTEINFPREDGVACTRFATVISLRRAAQEKLTVEIIPHANQSPEMKSKLRAFREETDKFEEIAAELGALVERAKAAMGIDRGRDSSDSIGGNGGFSSDVLKIEVCGPQRPQLTIVDLPGLFKNDQGASTTREALLVENLTRQFIREPRTICLPVITASYDPANQGIFKMVRQEDPEGHRTMGIITRPDRLEEGSSQAKYVALAQNDIKEYHLAKGWHVLRNRSPEQLSTFAARNESEDLFFENSAFRVVNPSHRGIVALRKRLGYILFQFTKEELPKIREEVSTRLIATRRALTELGNERIQPVACRDYLIKVAQDAWKVCNDASLGHFDDSFYQDVEIGDFNARGPIAIRRLRAVLRDCYTRFVKDIAENGHTWNIDPTPSLFGMSSVSGGTAALGKRVSDERSLADTFSFEERRLKDGNYFASPSERSGTSQIVEAKSKSPGLFGSSKPKLFAPSNMFSARGGPTHMPLQEMARKISEEMKMNRGTEMKGQSNARVVKTLFMKQTKRWIPMAEQHIENVSKICQTFMQQVLEQTCTPEVRAKIWSHHLEDVIERRKSAALLMFEVLKRSLEQSPLNDSDVFEQCLGKVRQRREERERAAQDETMKTSGSNILGKFTAPSPVKLADDVQDTLDRMNALYETKQVVFVDNINSLVIEDNLIRGLADMLSPLWVSSLSDEKLQQLAQEPDSTQNERRRHSDTLVRLLKGDKILRSML